MTEADIYPLISDIASGQVYPYVVPLNSQSEPAVSPPWLIFSLISGVDADVLCGQAETVTSIQFDVFALTIEQVNQIRSEVLSAILPLKPVNISRTNSYESDTHLYRATTEVHILQ